MVEPKGFRIKYAGHELAARKLLLDKKLVPAAELALMSAEEVAFAIQETYESIEVGEDWMLVPHDKAAEFQALITWIER